MRYHRRYIFLFFVFFLMIVSTDCSNSSDPSRREGSEKANNVLLITLDTTRSDHLSCYGYRERTTPVIDKLAEGGVRFEQAFTHVPITLPSHATIMTGVYPKEHGIRANGRNRLGDELMTLAEIFVDHGYRTGAFIGAVVLDAQFGLDRGFEVYDDDMSSGKSAGVGHYRERSANQVIDSALKWLQKGKKEPFFCFIHLFDPHGPYNPPSPFRERFAHTYDGEIAYADSQLKRLLDWLDSNRLRDNTLIVLTSDHGEGLGEHEENTHAMFIYDATMHIPLIFSFAGQIETNKIIRNVVGLVDLFPTILEFMNWEVPVQYSGRSLVRVLKGKELEDVPIYGETAYPLLSHGWSDLKSLTTQEWKYIRAPKRELYDRKSDSHEQHNLAEKNQKILQELNYELDAIEGKMTPGKGERVLLDEETKKALESLGYLQGGHTAVDSREPVIRKDPKDMVKILRKLDESILFLNDGKYRDAYEILKEIVRLSPESPQIRGTLGIVYMQLGETSKAAKELKIATSLDPNNGEANCNYGLLLLKQGQPGRAIPFFQKALNENPDHLLTLMSLAGALVTEGRLGEAIEYYRKTLEVEPNHIAAHVNMGGILFGQNRFEEAATEFEQALALNPQDVNILFNLSAAYIKLGKTGSAIEQLKNLLSIEPENQKAVSHLSKLLMQQNRLDEGIMYLQMLLRLNPKDAQAHYNMAVAGYLSNRYDLAWKHIGLARKLGYNISPTFLERLQNASDKAIKQ